MNFIILGVKGIVSPCRVRDSVPKIFYIFALISLLGLAACTPQQPSVPTSDAILTDGNLPKRLATVDLVAVSALDAAPQLESEDQASDFASSAVPQASLTPIQVPTGAALIGVESPTPYVGVFAGEGVNLNPPTAIISTQAPTQAASLPNLDARNCEIEVAAAFANARTLNPGLQRFGCPLAPEIGTALAAQNFERGRMFWRDTRQIIIMSEAGQFWRVNDTWTDDQAASDPALVPPEGALQPMRGFGLVWRQNPELQNSLGWALGPEFVIASIWQEFEGGTLFLGESSHIYAIPQGTNGQYAGGFPQ